MIIHLSWFGLNFLCFVLQSARDESPIAHKTPPRQSTSSIQVSEEELQQYFASADPLQKVSSPSSSHLEKVDETLMGEIPTDKGRVADLRASLFKLSESPDVPSASRKLYRQMALQVNDISAVYQLSRENYDHATQDLQRLRDLQAQKSSFLSSYQAVDRERQADLARKGELKDRLHQLNLEFTRIQNAIKELTPQLEQLDARLETHTERRFSLYVQASSLDPDILRLTTQKDGLEQDMQRGREGVDSANHQWDELRLLLNQAKEQPPTPSAEAGTVQAEESASAALESAPADVVATEVLATSGPLRFFLLGRRTWLLM